MNFLQVSSHFFKVGMSYPFRIFLFDSERENRMSSLIERTDLDQTKMDEWIEFEEKGARLQIHQADLESLYDFTDATEELVRVENKVYFKCIEIQQKRFDLFSHVVEMPFDLKKCIKEISKSRNYLPLIERVKAEIMCFDLTLSHDVSICTAIVEKVFQKDIFPVRVAALSYMIAKVNKISESEELADIVFAALYRDVGHCMINRNLFEDKEKLVESSYYLKHPMLSIYILSKTGFDFNKHIKRFILEHHEQSDGSGFPRQKKEEHIHRNSFIINMAEQLITNSMHKSEEMGEDQLTKLLWAMRQKSQHPKLNTSFPDELCSSLLNLIKLEEG